MPIKKVTPATTPSTPYHDCERRPKLPDNNASQSYTSTQKVAAMTNIEHPANIVARVAPLSSDPDPDPELAVELAADPALEEVTPASGMLLVSEPPKYHDPMLVSVPSPVSMATFAPTLLTVERKEPKYE